MLPKHVPPAIVFVRKPTVCSVVACQGRPAGSRFWEGGMHGVIQANLWERAEYWKARRQGCVADERTSKERRHVCAVRPRF